MFSALVFVALLAGPPDEQAIWKEFSGWFSREGIPGAPTEVVKAWSAKLTKDGTPAEEADAKAKLLQGYMAAHPKEALTLHFDRIFTWKDAPFSKEPSALVMKLAKTLKPGAALDIAMGQGRNSIWLAKQGWAVSGYDISPEALRQANTAAEAGGVKLNTSLASHEEYDLGTGRWDLIVMSFAFTKLSDEAYMQRVHDALKPGGVLVVEGFNGPPGGRSGEANMILKAFMKYRVLVYEDLPDISDWGKVKAPLLRMAVQRQ